MKSGYISFLNVWNIVVHIVAALSILTGIIILIVHWLRSSSLKEYKLKYDYLSTHDVKMILNFVIAVAIGVTLYVNALYPAVVKLSYVWFFVRLFISLCIGTLIIYVSYLMLKYAYPTKLEKKLRKWRYKTRINPKTGNKMKLLSEEEEDVHLDEGMQAEENVFSVDYDVWVDEETGDVKIEKYPGYLQALQCNSCGFQTMKLIKEEIVEAPTETTEGQIHKYYKCTYCGSKRSKMVKVARLSQNEPHFELPAHLHFKEEEKVSLVTLEILISNGKTKIFEFSTTQQASEFLKEFDIEQINE